MAHRRVSGLSRYYPSSIVGGNMRSPEYVDRPMLGAISSCCNVTGVLIDIHVVACLLHQHGVFACFDFAASRPYMEIDMRSGKTDGYDAVFFSLHKFVSGPGMPGILLLNQTLYHLIGMPSIVQKVHVSLALWVKKHISRDVIAF
ncbi:uncharacterized protein LOC133886490 [Phragmites australis]|uniref:uncharacterized protein LOC133886490 n=1 Tax=Phragmites australis TaxID=29695 RepID=UPI002D7796BF|nr:uncharacterized protein LOC133886490 [Phragmites australis]